MQLCAFVFIPLRDADVEKMIPEVDVEKLSLQLPTSFFISLRDVDVEKMIPVPHFPLTMVA